MFKERDVLVHFFFDDLIITEKREGNIAELKLKFASKLSARDIGEATNYFGMNILQTFKSISLFHEKYVDILF